MLQTVIDIVKEAARIMTSGDFTVKTKENPDNLVTSKDVAVEAFIRKAIAERIPGAGFIGEEEDFSADALTREYTAVVDPIDGTMNFTRQMNLSVVSVALLHHGKPYIGVVLNPYTDELFYAERGKGAYLNGERIHVSDRPLRQACYFTAWSTYRKEYAPPCFDIAKEVYADTCDIRRLGVCALELCYLAAGRGELYFEIRVFPWDFAAAEVIVLEAGGVLGTLRGEPTVYTRPQPILAANSEKNFAYLAEKVQKYVPVVPYEN